MDSFGFNGVGVEISAPFQKNASAHSRTQMLKTFGLGISMQEPEIKFVLYESVLILFDGQHERTNRKQRTR